MLTFRFNGADGKMYGAEVLTAGMVGRKIRLEFSRDWDGMSKTVVFTAGEVTRDVLVDSDMVVIPADVLQTPLKQLVVGVYGVAEDGRVMPTVQVPGPYICEGTDPSGDESVDPGLPVWAQIQIRLDALENGILEADLTELNLHSDETGTWVYLLNGRLDVAAILNALRADSQIRLRLSRKGNPVTVMLDNCRITERGAVCSGMFEEVLSGSEAVQGIITLEIFDSDNAVVVACMNPMEKLKNELETRILESENAIQRIPVSVTADGYTEITGQRRPTSIRTVREGNRITVTTTFQGGVIDTEVVTLNEDGFPESVEHDGLTCTLEFDGVEEVEEGEV